jgi:hypothetical protein
MLLRGNSANTQVLAYLKCPLLTIGLIIRCMSLSDRIIIVVVVVVVFFRKPSISSGTLAEDSFRFTHSSDNILAERNNFALSAFLSDLVSELQKPA